MKANKILNSDVKDILISSLPSRPTAPKSLGGKGYGASEMKQAFDRLPLYIIDRYNELIDDVGAIGEDSLASAIPSGIRDGHTLSDLFEDVRTGELASHLTFFGKSLLAHIIYLYCELDDLKRKIEEKESV